MALVGSSAGRRCGEQPWVGTLPDVFSMTELLERAEAVGPRPALAWLYLAIERGRVEPIQAQGDLLYRFAGTRRSGDHRSEATDPELTTG
jgi:hypothetical protein